MRTQRELGVVFGFILTVSPLLARAAERVVELEKAYNVRDLGGYPAAAGKTVRWGLVYRSGDLHTLSDGDVEELRRRGIATVVDFRTDREREDEPHRLPATVRHVADLPITPGNLPDFETLTDKEAADILVRVNRELVTEARPQYRAFFRELADPANLPLLFNCSAGKDRTGLAAALFLSSLGVDRETVFGDYLLSAVHLRDKYQSQIDENPGLAPLYTVRREYLQAAFDEIDSRYGGTEAYLREQLGVDVELMRRLYTE